MLILQLIYGGFMAGLRAATTAPTWPDINGSMLPAGLSELSPFIKNLVANPIAIHFIHRGLAYLLIVLIATWWFRSRVVTKSKLFSRLRITVMLLVLLQVLLGILTVLHATYPNRLVVLGVSHQFVAMVLLMIVVSLLFVVRKKQVL